MGAALRHTSSQKFRSGAETNVAQFFGAFSECTSSVEVVAANETSLIYIGVDEDLEPTRLFESVQPLYLWQAKIERGERRIDVVELKAFARLYKKSLDYFI